MNTMIEENFYCFQNTVNCGLSIIIKHICFIPSPNKAMWKYKFKEPNICSLKYAHIKCAVVSNMIIVLIYLKTTFLPKM